MDILVLGGTGAMGTPLVEILSEMGHSVYVTSRTKKDNKKNIGIHYIRGNALDLDFLRETIQRGWDIIVDFMSYNEQDFRKRYEMLLENTKCYFFLSSARVYADSNEVLITEESPRLLDKAEDAKFLNTTDYSLEKAREENILLDGKKRNFVIIRPYITYNTDRLQLGIYEKEAWLQRALSGKKIVFSREIAKKYTTLTYGYDVAKYISELVVVSDTIKGEIFQIASHYCIKWNDIFNLYLDILEEYMGFRPEVVWIEGVDGYTQRKLFYYQAHYDRMFNRRFSSDKLSEVLNKNLIFTDVKEGLRICLQEFLDMGGHFLNKNWAREGALDKISGDKTQICKIPGFKNKCKYFLFRYIL